MKYGVKTRDLRIVRETRHYKGPEVRKVVVLVLNDGERWDRLSVSNR